MVYAALLPITNELNRWVPSGMVWFFHPGNRMISSGGGSWTNGINLCLGTCNHTSWILANIPLQGLLYDGRGSSTTMKGKSETSVLGLQLHPRGAQEHGELHAAWEHSTMPWSVGGHRTKSIWAYYKAGLWKEAAQPSSHMQGSGPGKDPGPGTQTQAALLEEQLKSQLPSARFIGHPRP